MTSRTFWAKWGRLIFTMVASFPAAILLFGVPSPGMFFCMVVLPHVGLADLRISFPLTFAVNFASSFAFFWWLLSFASDVPDGKDAKRDDLPGRVGKREWVVLLQLGTLAIGMCALTVMTFNLRALGFLIVTFIFTRLGGTDIGVFVLAGLCVEIALWFFIFLLIRACWQHFRRASN